ncbi:MAG: ABC transporter permease subunit [Candidatus Thorarchaeota archaeon]
MSKSMVVAITDFKNALKLRFIKMGMVMSAAFGPIMVIGMTVILAVSVPPSEFSMVTGFLVPMIGGFLGLFAIIPTTMISANALVGEREMNTLEPLLCTPLTDRELLWGKTLASALPSLIILVSSVAATSIGTNVILFVLGYPLILIPDLPGFFLLATATPIMIFAIVAVMIIISGRVTRVYEAYQTASGVILVFMIPLFLPLFGMGSSDASYGWLSSIITLLISAVLFAVAWFIAFRLFNRDKLVSMV